MGDRYPAANNRPSTNFRVKRECTNEEGHLIAELRRALENLRALEAITEVGLSTLRLDELLDQLIKRMVEFTMVCVRTTIGPSIYALPMAAPMPSEEQPPNRARRGGTFTDVEVALIAKNKHC